MLGSLRPHEPQPDLGVGVKVAYLITHVHIDNPIDIDTCGESVLLTMDMYGYVYTVNATIFELLGIKLYSESYHEP